MKFLLLAILSPLAVYAAEPNCDDRNNLPQSSLNVCSSKDSLESEKRLSVVLEPETLRKWNEISHQACLEAWKSYKRGSIYSLIVNQCKTRMNNYIYYSSKGGMKGMDDRFDLLP